MSWIGTKEKRRREGRREEAEGCKNSKYKRRRRIVKLLVVVRFSFSNSTYELAFQIYCSPKPNWLYEPQH